MTALIIHTTKPLPSGLLTTLKRVNAQVNTIANQTEDDFGYLHALTAEEEEEAFKQATRDNQRRFWSRNSQLL